MSLAVAILILIILHILLTRTYLGKAIRAVTQNRNAALIAGVNADRISAVAFGLGTALAGAAGTLLSTMYAFTPDFGRSFLLKSFCIIVLAGMESVPGVAAGAFVLALLAYKAASIRGMMSATGLLYVAVGCVLAGEVLARGLLFATGAAV